MIKKSTVAVCCALLLLTVPVLSQARTIVVGYNSDPPLSFSERGGAVKGVFADLVKHIAQKEGWSIDYRQCDWGECLELLKSAEIDLLLTIARTEQREPLFDFTQEPVLSNWGVFYLKNGKELESTLDLNRWKIGVLSGDVYYIYFKELGEKFDIAPEFVEVGSYGEVLELIESGTVDGGIFSRIFGTYHEADHPIVKSSISFRPVELHIAAPKGQNGDLLAAIDRHLVTLKKNKNSIYYQSIDTWIEGVSRLALPNWMNPLWMLFVVVLFIATILVGNVILRWQVRSRTNALRETISAKEQIESELRVAHDIQMQSIPAVFPPFPDRIEIDIYATLRPAREVGGDFYDFFFIDEDRLLFLIGDVSGKGVPAALFMSAVKTLTKASATFLKLPAQLMGLVNREIGQGNDSCTFVTMFCGVLDVSDGTLVYTNAGHNPPLLLKNNGSAEYFPTSNSTLVGFDEEAKYHETEMVLAPGDSICLFTDGVTEALNSAGDEFSEERLLREISTLSGFSMQTLVEELSRSIATFTAGTDQFDDITILALSYLGKGMK